VPARSRSSALISASSISADVQQSRLQHIGYVRDQATPKWTPGAGSIELAEVFHPGPDSFR